MKKNKELTAKMTLEEKAAFLSGKDEWSTRGFTHLGISPICFADGPAGIRRQEGDGDHLGLNPSLPATCFPSAAAVANSWDEELGQRIGEALGGEAASLGVDVVLAPALNIKRSPLCGRNFEYFSEDPYLSGKMAAAYIRGIQSQGVYACAKHFAVNNQEQRRMVMNAVLDERTLREIYLTGFEIAVKEGQVKSVMTSYNEVNGTYANENPHLLRDILRDEWGFEGFVVTDWGGSNDHVKGVAAGSDLEMPSPGLDSARQLLEAVQDRTLKESSIDACAERLLAAERELSEARKKRKESPKAASLNQTSHHDLAAKAAAESMVLLKNEENLLPLKKGCKAALIGDFVFEPRYQGSGSSKVNPVQVDTMEKLAGEYELHITGMARGYVRTGEADANLAQEALRLAESADVILFCMGLDELSESEGLERTHLKVNQNQIQLLREIASVNPHVAVILNGGSVMEISWDESCQAILHTFLSGEAGARAVFDILTGKVNPSGKLAESYPLRYEDTPAFHYFPARERSSEYREGLYVGYRYYSTAGVKVKYPFGYGLSYTVFTYSQFKIHEKGVSFVIENTGERDGAEIAQMYVSLPEAEVFRPLRELKGFKKVFLRAGEKKTVTILFDDKSFRYWNVRTNQWEQEEGTYEIQIGTSSEDIRWKGTIWKPATTDRLPYLKKNMSLYYSGKIQQVDDVQFIELIGAPIPSGKWEGELGENDALCQMYYAKSGLARLVYCILTGLKKRSEKKGKPDLNLLFIYNMPFRGIAKMTHGMVGRETVDGLVLMVNGQFFKGIKKAAGGYFRNRRENRAYEKRLQQLTLLHRDQET